MWLAVIYAPSPSGKKIFENKNYNIIHCPASLIVRPWFLTWSTNFALISSEILFRAYRLWPCPTPLSLCLPLLLSLPLALPASLLAKFSQWLNWGLFVVSWLVINFVSSVFRCVSKCFQSPNVFYILNRCVFPMVPMRFHLWTKCLMYEIVCSVQEQVCCRIATEV